MADTARKSLFSPRLFHSTDLGRVYLGESLQTLDECVDGESVDLVMTSPPFGLVRKKEYGNADADAGRKRRSQPG